MNNTNDKIITKTNTYEQTNYRRSSSPTGCRSQPGET